MRLWVKADTKNSSHRPLIFLKKRGVLGNILRPILNLRGLGYYSCFRCGDSAYWKEMHTLSFLGGGMAPCCEECWNQIGVDEKKMYVEDCIDKWKRPSLLRGVTTYHGHSWENAKTEALAAVDREVENKN